MSVLGYICGLDLGQSLDATARVVIEVQDREGPYVYYVRESFRYPLRTSYPTIVRDMVSFLQRVALRGQTTLYHFAIYPVHEWRRRDRYSP
jgi:hypothetical protein